MFKHFRSVRNQTSKKSISDVFKPAKSFKNDSKIILNFFFSSSCLHKEPDFEHIFLIVILCSFSLQLRPIFNTPQPFFKLIQPRIIL
jgi:hypothetical protein